jgi:hypothetical protein
MKYAAFLVVLAMAMPAAHGVAAQVQVKQLLENGPAHARINIVFLAEGYTVGEFGQFDADAQWMLDHLLSTEPYRSYRDHFNAFAIAVASNQSGSDHPSKGIYRDTYFNSSFDSFGHARLITIPPNNFDGSYANGQGRVDAILRNHMPEFDIVIMLVNDPAYGGSGGRISISSVNSAAREIVVHEVGHTFGLLADEYSSAYPGWVPREFPNATAHTSRGSIPWRDWIASITPIPTPAWAGYSGVVGLFEGAQYHTSGWYRPKETCKMNVLGVDFCEVCREAHVHAIYNLLDPVESFEPADNTVSASTGDSLMFRVDLIEPVTHALSVRWLVDGQEVDASGPTLVLPPGYLAAGSYVVAVDISDETGMVRRTDFLPRLQTSLTWFLAVATSIDDGPETRRFVLDAPYPNPASNHVSFSFSMPSAATANLAVYDMLGRRIATLADGYFTEGRHSVSFETGELAPGVYVARLTGQEGARVVTMAVVR